MYVLRGDAGPQFDRVIRLGSQVRQQHGVVPIATPETQEHVVVGAGHPGTLKIVEKGFGIQLTSILESEAGADAIVTRAAFDHIEIGYRDAIPEDRLETVGGGDDQVVASAAEYRIVAAVGQDRIVAGAAVDAIVTGQAIDGVIAAQSIDEVATVAGAQPIRAFGPEPAHLACDLLAGQKAAIGKLEAPEGVAVTVAIPRGEAETAVADAGWGFGDRLAAKRGTQCQGGVIAVDMHGDVGRAFREVAGDL